MNSERHIYRGVHSAGGVRVTVDGYLLLDPALTIPESARGASWGGREGALQVLAYAILAYDLGELAADAVCDIFMPYLRTRLPPESSGDDWAMSSHEIRAWYRRHVAPRAGGATDPQRLEVKRAAEV
jgi:hypothetical protein